MRIGFGYDLHRIVEGRPLILAGVDIPNEFGLDGHSDADCVLHALIDALLGAFAMGDIGQHFPDTDPEFSGIDSGKLLREAMSRIFEKQPFSIKNIDVTIIAEAPKMMPFISKMQTNVARLLEVDKSRISIKATTKEGLQPDAISAHCVVLVDER